MGNILLRSENDLRTLNNAKPYFFLNEMNKKVLPAIYSAAVWCLFVVLLFFWPYCVTTVTAFIERSESRSLPSGRYQSMKPMIGKSIDQSMIIDALLVNWHRLASANR